MKQNHMAQTIFIKHIYYCINNIVNREGKTLTSSLNNKFNKMVKAERIAKRIHPNLNVGNN